MACCAIHYLDLITWWTDEKLISVHTEGLNKNWIESKRNGFYEITGELKAKFIGGTELVLQSYPNLTGLDYTVELSNKDVWTIHEVEGKASSSNGEILNGRTVFQSEITGPMVTGLLTRKTCNLPTLKESIVQHEIFLDAMLKHWNLSNNSNDKLIPIT